MKRKVDEVKDFKKEVNPVVVTQKDQSLLEDEEKPAKKSASKKKDDLIKKDETLKVDDSLNVEQNISSNLTDDGVADDKFAGDSKIDESTTKKKSKKDKKGEKKKKSHKMKKSTRFTLLIVILVGMFCGVAVGLYFGPKSVDPNRYNFEVSALLDDVDEIRNEASGKTPVELGATKSCVLAFDTTFNEGRVKVVGRGSVLAMGVTQSISALTIRMNDKLYYENVSVSNFVKALNRYYVEGENISHYGGSLSGNIVTWNTTPDNTGADDIKTMTQHKAKFGSTMNEYMTYIVSSKTVNTASAVTVNDDGNYVFTLTLDKSKSVVNYVKTMKATGGLSSYPDFTSDPRVDIIIDANYRILRFESHEEYTVSMGISAKSVGTLVNTFYYDEDFAMPKITDKSVV